MNYKNISIEEFSSPVQEAAAPNMSISEITHFFKTNGFRHMPVIEGNEPVGIISDRDIALLACFSGKDHLLAKDIMVKDPYCVSLGTPLHEVVLEMSEKKIGSALIVDADGKLDSIFTSIDGLNALVEVLRGDI